MTDRRKTALILGMTTLFMFSPLAMSLFWRIQSPCFKILALTRESIAPPLAWILATITAIAYVLYTMKVIPLVFAKQKEISLFKLLGILSALVGGIVEEVFFRRWIMDMLMSRGVSPHSPGHHFRRCFWISPHQLDSLAKATSSLRFRQFSRHPF